MINAESECQAVCLLVLCGIPASGKTTVAKTLVHQESSTEYAFVSIPFDELMPASLEAQLINTKGEETRVEGQSDWKQYREAIFECVEKFVEWVQDNNGSSSPVSQRPRSIQSELWERFITAAPMVNPYTQPVCVVIDDNMYYRSMRYSYFQLARKYHTGYCEVHIECSVQQALERNNRRTDKVTNDVITTMASKFEKPNPSIYGWEKHSVSFESGEDFNITPILQLVEQSIQDPVEPVITEDTEEQKKARDICSSSLLHQADQILRRLVSSHIKSLSGNGCCSKDKVKQVAAYTQQTRKDILEMLKTGLLPLNAEVQQNALNAATDTANPLYKFLQQTFVSYLTKLS